MPNFTIGLPGSDHLTVHVQGPDKPIHRQFDWVDVEVEIKAGGFTGSFDAHFMVQDFSQLRSDLVGFTMP